MQFDLGAHRKPRQHYFDTKSQLKEFEAILESDFLSYLHPSVVASMKSLIARQLRKL